MGQGLSPVCGESQWPCHVGLSTTEPDFADEDVVEGADEAAIFSDGETMGTAGCERANRECPTAIGVCGGLVLFAEDVHADAATCFGLSPNGDALAVLEDHARVDERSQLDAGMASTRNTPKTGDNNKDETE